MTSKVEYRKINRTVCRAVNILQLIKDHGDSLTLKEISRLTKIPCSSAFDIVHTLYMEKFLEYKSGTKAFSIGVKAFEVGSAYRNNTNLIEVIHPYVEKLKRLFKATSFFAIVDDTEIIYLDKAEAETSVRTSAVLGSRRDMYSTGLGKAIMMYYPEEKVRAILASSKFIAHTKYTITDVGKFLEEMEKSRDRGYAVDNRESNIDVFCIAHALFDSYGNPFGAISIATMFSASTESAMAQYGENISKCAWEISKKLGYLGPEI